MLQRSRNFHFKFVIISRLCKGGVNTRAHPQLQAPSNVLQRVYDPIKARKSLRTQGRNEDVRLKKKFFARWLRLMISRCDITVAAM